MNKKLLLIVKNITPVLLFNIIFFVTWGIKNPTSVWISYVLIHLAYGAFVLSSLFNKESKHNRFFSFTNTTISLVYCILQFVAGLVFIILSMESVNISLYVQLPLLGIFIALIIYNVALNQRTESNTDARENELNFIRQCNLKLSLIMANHSDPTVVTQFTKAKELMETSPSKSYLEVKEMETEMLAILDEIEQIDATDIENLIRSIKKLINITNKRSATIKTLH